jgi:hypothetical protein
MASQFEMIVVNGYKDGAIHHVPVALGGFADGYADAWIWHAVNMSDMIRAPRSGTLL